MLYYFQISIHNYYQLLKFQVVKTLRQFKYLYSYMAINLCIYQLIYYNIHVFAYSKILFQLLLHNK